MIKILIADPSEEYRFALTNLLQQDYTVLACSSGDQALELLRRERPDLLVMDLMLSGLDGLGLLAQARKEGLCPPALVSSLFLQDHIINALQKENVVYLVRKPCNLDALISRIRELTREAPASVFLSPDPRSVVNAALFELGIPAARLGCANCREAILLLRADPGASLSKEIYPAIAQRQGVSSTSVEKNIRDAIADGYSRRNEAVWRRYFPIAPDGRVHKPTNRQFLACMVQMLFEMAKEA